MSWSRVRPHSYRRAAALIALALMVVSTLTAAHAEEEERRLQRLVLSPVMDRLTTLGFRATARTAFTLEMICDDCAVGAAHLSFAVQVGDAGDAPQGKLAAYIGEREATCAALVQQQRGRCVGTRQVGWSWMKGRMISLITIMLTAPFIYWGMSEVVCQSALLRNVTTW